MYDGHGNMISTLGKNGSGYTYSALRVFDAWGQVRLGATTGDPKGRYCANLGHVADDESGLVYMRARYYEPSSGRFVSEDPARDGANWFTYARNNPVKFADSSGRSPILVIGAIIIGSIMLALGHHVGKEAALYVIRKEALKHTSCFCGEQEDVGDALDHVLAAQSMLRDILVSGIAAGGAACVGALLGASSTSVGLVAAIAFGVGFLVGFYDVMVTYLIMDVANGV
jgi:RHS repeat-associated protein